MRKILVTLALLAAPSALAAQFMTTFEKNGAILSGAEYWPYVGTTDIAYPDDVLWDFYPEGATPAAVACAEQAYRRLERFVANDDATWKRIVELGASEGYTNKFYLWTNDYARAADPFPFPRRVNRLWYWKRNPPLPDRAPGYWKWESTLTQDGRCLVPEDAQIRAYLDETLQRLEGR